MFIGANGQERERTRPWTVSLLESSAQAVLLERESIIAAKITQRLKKKSQDNLLMCVIEGREAEKAQAGE